MLRDSIKCSIRNITRKKFRSFLTISAISIGVASVVLIDTIGNVGKNTINNELNCLGIGSISISTDKKNNDYVLTAKDLEVIKSNSAVENAVPVIMEYTDTAMRELAAKSVVWGTDSGANQVISITPTHGRLISKGDVSNCEAVCVIDENAAKAFYKRNNIVGKKLRLLLKSEYHEFEIIGIAKSQGNLLQNLLSDYIPSFIYIPYTTMQKYTGKNGFDQITIKINKQYEPMSIGNTLISKITGQNSNSTHLKLENLSKQRDQLDNLMNIVTFILSAIASVSLIVAGLGIMTVMIVSVNERTREIGIKKSIGATCKNILTEFLFEAFIISFFGSAVGAIIGTSVAYIGCYTLSLKAIYNINQIFICITLSTAIGVIFGVYPALIASKLRPVDALRLE